MPVIDSSNFRRSPLFFNGHIETIGAAVLRKISDVHYERERLHLSDGDFVDLDWLDNGSRRLVVLSHGLEGDSSRQYVSGMARYFFNQKWDVLAWNCRSCSGEMNKALRMYHHGEIGDIGEVIQHAIRTKDFEQIILIGFSMGGNINMKYLGVHGKEAPSIIKACIAFSSPTDLKAGAEILNEPSNFIYYRRFIRYLKVKLEKKNEQYPGVFDLENFKKIREWRDFDEFFTVPLNGFKDAEEFYEIASAKNFLPGIKVPTLLIQAQNDPILPKECYPVALCNKLEHVFLEMPMHGGHVGFWKPGERYAWSELRAGNFIKGI